MLDEEGKWMDTGRGDANLGPLSPLSPEQATKRW